jgi:hypothetical protein
MPSFYDISGVLKTYGNYIENNVSTIVPNILVLILFIFSFVCLFKANLELFGYGLAFSAQIVVLFLYMNNLFFQKNVKRDVAAIDIFSYHVPISWILFAGGSLQFTSFVFMIIVLRHLQMNFLKKGKSIQLSPTNRISFDTYRILFVIAFTLMAVLYIVDANYMNISDPKSAIVKNIVFIFFSSALLGITSYEVYLANGLSKLIKTSTDG